MGRDERPKGIALQESIRVLGCLDASNVRTRMTSSVGRRFVVLHRTSCDKSSDSAIPVHDALPDEFPTPRDL